MSRLKPLIADDVLNVITDGLGITNCRARDAWRRLKLKYGGKDPILVSECLTEINAAVFDMALFSPMDFLSRFKFLVCKYKDRATNPVSDSLIRKKSFIVMVVKLNQ